MAHRQLLADPTATGDHISTEPGVPSVHFHDLRHTGNALTAHSGATLSDLMARMGHSSTRAARIYLHTSSDWDLAVAAALDELIGSSSGTGA